MVTFTNNRIDGAIVGEDVQRYQSKINPAGVVTTGDLAAEVAENLKETKAYAETVIKEYNSAAAAKLALGNRVLLDGLCRLELYGEGTFDSEDEQWNGAKHRIVVRAIPYDEIKYAALDVVPVNTLSPVSIQLLGAQDQTTLEQNSITLGNVLLLQGKNLQHNASFEDEGVFLVNAEHEYRGTITAATAGTNDVTWPLDMAPGEYTLERRGRAGCGRNRMLVTSKISGFTVKAAA